MCYWHCAPHLNSRIVITAIALVASGLVIIGQYHLLQIGFILLLISGLCGYALQQHNKLPVVISFDQAQWRCIYRDKILNGSMKHGFVLGPLAILNLEVDETVPSRLLIGMLYWDVVSDQKSPACNWNQLRTILSYSHRDNKPKNDIWLSG